MRIYCKDFNKLKYFNQNQGGVKVLAGSITNILAGR
jgi:hypothetical protein